MQLNVLSVIGIVSGALLAQAGTAPSQAGTDSRHAERLMKEIKVNSEQIRSAAIKIEGLAKQPDAKWSDYDQQWNIIKPAQEKIALAEQRLERMQGSLSAQEQQALNQTKSDVNEITRATHDLWMKIGQPKPDLKTRPLNADARGLDKASRDLIKTAV